MQESITSRDSGSGNMSIGHYRGRSSSGYFSTAGTEGRFSARTGSPLTRSSAVWSSGPPGSSGSLRRGTRWRRASTPGRLTERKLP